MKIRWTQAGLALGRHLGAATMIAVLTTGCSGGGDMGKGDWSAAAADSTQAIDHAAWDGLLSKYVKAYPDGVNRVDYAAMKKNDAATLTAYLVEMQAVDIGAYNKNEQFAYWVNLYNAATVDVILREYPIKSIKDIGILGQGPWKDKILTVNGKKLSLDDIEHGILRPTWADVRIHYAVNCASIGCPNLAARAYTAAQLEPMLDDAAKAFINHPRGFTSVDGSLVASSIFDWYGDDWGDQAAILDHARRYATDVTKAEIGDATQIDSFDYNWSLNDAT